MPSRIFQLESDVTIKDLHGDAPFVLGVLYHLTPGCWIILTKSTPTGSSLQWYETVQGYNVHVSLDSFTGRHPGNYLQRSSDLIQMSACPGGSATDNSIDHGPSMVHKSTLCVLQKVRRVDNILFTRCFAEVFLRLMLLNDSRLRRCMDLFQTHIQLSGNELGRLVPEHPKTMRTLQLLLLFLPDVACCTGAAISPLL